LNCRAGGATGSTFKGACGAAGALPVPCATAIGGGAGSPSRTIVTSTWVPAGPRSSLKTSSLVMPRASGAPSTSVMRSPARSPSRKAGVPSSGEMTTMALSRSSNWMPMPEYSPRKFSSMRSARCGGTKTECGSSVLSMPSIAPRMSFSLSGSST